MKCAICLFAVLGSSIACGGAETPPTQPPDAATGCELALSAKVRGSDGHFTDLAAARDADLVLGFQGFRYLYTQVHLDRAPPLSNGYVRVEVDGSGPLSQPFRLVLHAGPGGGLETEPFPVFFNDSPLPMLIGRSCIMTLHVGDLACGAEVTGRFILTYRAGCIEDASGQRVCGDGGVTPSFDAGARG